MKLRNIMQGIAVHGDNVREFSVLDGAYILRMSNQVGGIESRRADRLRRCHAKTHHDGELSSVITMRINAGIRSEGHLHAGLERLLKCLALNAAYHFLFIDVLLRKSKLDCLSEQEIVVVDVHVEVTAVFLGETNVFI